MATHWKQTRAYFIHFTLFALTFLTTTLAGVQWLNQDPFKLSNFFLGLPYSISLLAVLSSHEFGHYFAARYHRIRTTLPYFIPVPPFLINPFGTLGAVIRIRSSMQSKRVLFDIGIAGPLIGFVVTLVVLLYGFWTLPSKEYLFNIHPEYRILGSIPTSGLAFGNSLLFLALTKLFAHHAFVPPMNEIYHYPFLCVGWFGLFVTALNLIPVGQLDGGHIVYAMFGSRNQRFFARTFFILLIVLGVGGLIPFFFGWSLSIGTPGWLLWAVILFFVIKLEHPPIPDEARLPAPRQFLGWLAIGIFITSFAPVPFWD